MSKRRQQDVGREAPVAGAIDPGPSMLSMVTLGAVLVVLVVAVLNWKQTNALSGRLDGLDSRLSALGTAVANAPAAQQQQPIPGPDRERQYPIKVDGAPSKGPATAPVTIAEFSDFQCPYCSRVGATLDKIRQVYGDKVRIVWKHHPLDMHPDAPLAHLASAAAHEQGKFWEYHDKLFANQRALKRENLLQYARELGLDMKRFQESLDSRRHQRTIDGDVAEALAVGAQGTPAFFVNGRFLSGAQPFPAFASLINQELERLKIPIPEEARLGG